MTKDQIQAVLDRVRTWPPERQEDAARTLLAMEQEGTDVYHLDEDDRADIEEALAEIERGDAPASDAEVEAVFARLTREA